MRDAVKINCQEIRKRFETFRTPDGQKVKHKYVAEKLGISHAAFAQHLKNQTMSLYRLKILADILGVAVEHFIASKDCAKDMLAGSNEDLLASIKTLINDQVESKLESIRKDIVSLTNRFDKHNACMDMNRDLIATNGELIKEVLELSKAYRDKNRG